VIFSDGMPACASTRCTVVWCTPICRAIVFTRQRSAWYRRRISASRSLLIMAPAIEGDGDAVPANALIEINGNFDL
jgi:hypothetical protein